MMSEQSVLRLVFVSHSGEDTWVARQNVLTHLDRAHEMVVLMTPWALTRPYVWAEIGAAWLRRIPIIVVLHGLTPRAFQELPNAPIFLKKRDIIVLNDIDQYFDQLRQRVTASHPGAPNGH